MSGKILIVDDESDIRNLLEEILSEEGYEVVSAADAAEARTAYTNEQPELILLDIWMPDTDGITLLREWADFGLSCPVVMMSGHGTVHTAVEATRLGAFDFVEKPLSLAKLLRVVEGGLEEGREKKPGPRLVPTLVTPVGKSRAMQELKEQIRRVAPHNASVMFVGEAGTGREAFARYLHSLSARADAPFVTLVCGSVTADNADLLLVGREENGDVHQGVLEQARGGVLFLNEIGDLPEAGQKILLGALERHRFMHTGGSEELPLDVTFISSAQPGIEHSSHFRKDLVSHMNVITLRIPSLSEYAEDVPDLLNYYVDVLVDKEGLPFRRFSVAAQNRLRNYPWPGNIRGLKNMVYRLLVLGGDEEITLGEVEQAILSETPETEPLVKRDLLGLPLREAREQFERAYLQQQLLLCEGKVGKLAQRVGMERTHLYRKLKSLGVEIGVTED